MTLKTYQLMQFEEGDTVKNKYEWIGVVIDTPKEDSYYFIYWFNEKPRFIKYLKDYVYSLEKI